MMMSRIMGFGRSRRRPASMMRRDTKSTRTATQGKYCEYKDAYLLLLWGGLQDVIHQNGHEFRHSVDASGVGSILGRAVYCLCLGLCLLQPFSGYRVYDVEYSQLVCSWCLLEVGVDLLDEDRLGLSDNGSATAGQMETTMSMESIPGCWRHRAM